MPSSNLRSSQYLLTRTNSNDSIFAPPAQQPLEKIRPERPSPSTKPQFPQTNNRMSIYASSSSRPRHTRSNSDSSVMELPPMRRPADKRDDRRPSDLTNYKSQARSGEDRDREREKERERERERRERRKEKESRSGSRHHTSSSSKDKKTSSSSRRSKKAVPLDTIDRLDVTGFFGPGNFHHDGPFDACTPHRNKHTKKAPVAAFPIDGANNSLSAVDPNRDRYATENQILGRSEEGEAFQDFSTGTARPLGRSHDNASTFDTTIKSNPIHGNTTAGLGSSTFLDGAPASRTAIEASAQQQQQGLGRKKSLAQRFRGGAAGQGPPVVVRRTSEQRGTSTGPSPTSPGDSPAGGRMSPIGVPVTMTTSMPKSPDTQTSPADSTPPKGNGLLRRVKSLKVGSSRRAAV